MSPELERLLNALFERDTCEPENRPQWDANIRRIVNDCLAGHPEISRERFLEAVHERYRVMRRARRKPPTMPALA